MKQTSTAIRSTPYAPKIAGAEDIPRWIRLSQLPGFMWAAIRAMGESVFSLFTSTRLDRIEVIAHLSGNYLHAGFNSRTVIDATAARLRRRSDPSRIVEYSTEQMAQFLGGRYQARAVQFEDPNYTYLMVQDPMGSYIYRWPSADTRHPMGGIMVSRTSLIGRNSEGH